MNSSLPFPTPGLGILMFVAAIGAIAGLCFFFHGFSLLQQRRFRASRTFSQSPAHTPAITTTAASCTKDTDTLSDSHHEVIHLSPTDLQPTNSVSMTQQAKIAAALLKAGIPNPVTSSGGRSQMAVRLADPPSNQDPVSGQTTDADTSRILQKSVTAPDLSLPSLNLKSPGLPSHWKTNLMIWGGPALTLTCIYILAARLGWL